MEWFIANWKEVLNIFFLVLGVASAVAKMTPNQSDNKAIDFVLKAINVLGLAKKAV